MDEQETINAYMKRQVAEDVAPNGLKTGKKLMKCLGGSSVDVKADRNATVDREEGEIVIIDTITMRIGW